MQWRKHEKTDASHSIRGINSALPHIRENAQNGSQAHLRSGYAQTDDLERCSIQRICARYEKVVKYAPSADKSKKPLA